MNETENCPSYIIDEFSGGHQRHDLFIIQISVNACLALTATLGNGMIIVAILRSQNLQTPSYLLITSLAFTDLLVGLVFHPFQIFWGVFSLQNNFQGICFVARAVMFITGFLADLSLMMVTCISIDRYLAITERYRYTIIVTKKRVRFLIVVAWIVSFFVSFLTILEHLYDILAAVASVLGFAMLSTTCVFYIKSFRALHLYTVQVQAQQPNPLAGNFDVVRYKKTLKTMLIVLACLLVCVPPLMFTAVSVYFLGFGKETMSSVLASSIIFGLSSSINPAIYLARMKDIRDACRETLRTWCRCS